MVQVAFKRKYSYRRVEFRSDIRVSVALRLTRVRNRSDKVLPTQQHLQDIRINDGVQISRLSSAHFMQTDRRSVVCVPV